MLVTIRMIMRVATAPVTAAMPYLSMDANWRWLRSWLPVLGCWSIFGVSW